MKRCLTCGKIDFRGNFHRFPDNSCMCSPCFEEYEKKIQKSNRESYLNNVYEIVRKIKEKGGLKLLEAFIKKHPDKEISDKDLLRLIDLIWETYKVYIASKDLALICDVLSMAGGEIEYHRDLDNFKNSILPEKEYKRLPKSTIQSKALFYSLKERGINCEIESFDGHKHIDISIPEAKLYIEIDGSQHSLNPNQIMSDLYRDQFSNENGYATKRIPNYMINEHLEEVSDAIAEVVKLRTKQI
jgi:very-short-patch-repair endonuclease